MACFLLYLFLVAVPRNSLQTDWRCLLTSSTNAKTHSSRQRNTALCCLKASVTSTGSVYLPYDCWCTHLPQIVTWHVPSPDLSAACRVASTRHIHPSNHNNTSNHVHIIVLVITAYESREGMLSDCCRPCWDPMNTCIHCDANNTLVWLTHIAADTNTSTSWLTDSGLSHM